jgi:hypothetical protein
MASLSVAHVPYFAASQKSNGVLVMVNRTLCVRPIQRGVAAAARHGHGLGHGPEI